jgi:hypothetical protein
MIEVISISKEMNGKDLTDRGIVIEKKIIYLRYFLGIGKIRADNSPKRGSEGFWRQGLRFTGPDDFDSLL